MTVDELKELLAASKVKPLVWEFGQAEGVSGHYRICRYSGQWWWTVDDEDVFLHGEFAESEHAAKAAVQADYEARILSALEPQPQIAAALIEATKYAEDAKRMAEAGYPVSALNLANQILSRIDAILEGKG